jgi:hypothetical protein
VEEPGLGVKARAPGVVGDLDLGAHLGERIEGATLGGADVGGGEDTQASGVAGEELAERLFDQAEAVPLEERAEEVNAIGRGELAADLWAHARVVGAVGEKLTDGEGDGRALGGLGGGERAQRFGEYRPQEPGRGVEFIAGDGAAGGGVLAEEGEDTVGKGELVRGAVSAFE